MRCNYTNTYLNIVCKIICIREHGAGALGEGRSRGRRGRGGKEAFGLRR
jgi:hypothetical protein